MTLRSERAQRLKFAKKMRAALEDQLESGVGIVSVSVDGTTVQYDREKALQEYFKWDKLVIRLSRGRGRMSTINLASQ